MTPVFRRLGVQKADQLFVMTPSSPSIRNTSGSLWYACHKQSTWAAEKWLKKPAPSLWNLSVNLLVSIYDYR